MKLLRSPFSSQWQIVSASPLEPILECVCRLIHSARQHSPDRSSFRDQISHEPNLGSKDSKTIAFLGMLPASRTCIQCMWADAPVALTDFQAARGHDGA